MRKTVVLLLLVFLLTGSAVFAGTLHSPLPYTNIGTPNDTLKISSIDLTPLQPVVGQPVIFRLRGTLTQPIMRG